MGVLAGTNVAGRKRLAGSRYRPMQGNCIECFEVQTECFYAGELHVYTEYFGVDTECFDIDTQLFRPIE